jgi:dTDP-4-amino-4,6-dideoxygalactose transaminase
MINYGRQFIDRSDHIAVKSALFSDWLTMGPKVHEFESEISKICGAPSFVVSSGTAALHCAYAAIDLKDGDEIITTPLTFIATQATAMQFGARIVFCDIDTQTGNIDPNSIEQLITTKTRAVTVVDYAGHPAELSKIREICNRNNIFMIEDAAHSFGSIYQDFPVGSIADLTTFSFFPTKNMTTGEGGAVSSINEGLLNKARLFGRQGVVKDPDQFLVSPDGKWHQEVHRIGLNYRLSDLQCALGISQIKKLQKFKEKRDSIFTYYNDNLSKITQIRLPIKSKNVNPMWHLYPARVLDGSRNSLFEYLWNLGIRTQVNYIPAYFHPVFQSLGYERGLCPKSEEFYAQEISLPIHPSLSKKDLKIVVAAITNFFGY